VEQAQVDLIKLDYTPQNIVARDMVLPSWSADGAGGGHVISGYSHEEAPYLPDARGLTGWEAIHCNPATYRVVIAGRRSGKSYGACWDLIRRATECPEALIRATGGSIQCWYLAPTYNQAKRIAWKKLKNFSRPLWDPEKPPNESELEIHLYNGMVISVKGCEKDPASLEGTPLWAAVIDECAEIEERIWAEHLQPSLTDGPIVDAGGGRVLFCTTPEGEGWVKEYYDEAAADTTGEWAAYRYASWQSQYYNFKKGQRTITRLAVRGDLETALQEYGAHFVAFAGRIYTRFTRETHVRSNWEVNPAWNVFVTLDHGTSNPTAVLTGGIDMEGRIWFRREYYAAGEECSTHARRIWAMLDEIDGSFVRRERSPEINIIDPSAKQETIEYASANLGKNQLFFTKGNNAWSPGVARVKEALLPVGGGLPGIIFHPECRIAIKQMLSLKYKERKGDPEADQYEGQEKKDDHFPDCIRYLVYSRPMAARPASTQAPRTLEERARQHLAALVARTRRAKFKGHPITGGRF
jgi:hypothetical protein